MTEPMSIEPTQADKAQAAKFIDPSDGDFAELAGLFARYRLACTPASGEVVAYLHHGPNEDEIALYTKIDRTLTTGQTPWSVTPLYAAPPNPAADLFAESAKNVAEQIAESANCSELVEALRWYAEQVEGCNRLTDDTCRNRLANDLGKRARAALSRYAMGSDLDKLARGHPLDTCGCGDYRRDHKDGTGPCQFNSPGFDLCHANEDCTAFRLSDPYNVMPLKAHIERTTS